MNNTASHRTPLFYASIALFVLVGAGRLSAADSSAVFSQLQIPSGGTPVPITGVELSSETQAAGSHSTVRVTYVTPELDFPFDYKVGVTLPDEFTFDSSLIATFSDDSPAPDPDLRSIEFIDNTVVFRFRRTFFAPKSGQRGIIQINTVTLPSRADNYVASVFISDTSFVALAGPGISDPLTVEPGPVTSLEITPDTAMTIRAGALALFNVTSRDAFGNSRNDPPDSYVWSFSDPGNPLGTLQPGAFVATKTGRNRIIAQLGELEDTSGIITVEPGELARLELHVSQPVFVGAEVCDSAYALLLDEFGNTQDGDELIGRTVQLSVSEGIVVPGEVTIASPNTGVIDLRSEGLLFDKYIGRTEFLLSLGSILSTPSQVNIEGALIQSPSLVIFPTSAPAGKHLRPAVFISAPEGIGVNIDSISFATPVSRLTVHSGLTPNAQFIADESEFVIAQPGDSLVMLETYASFFRGLGFSATCPSVYRQEFPIEFSAEPTVATVKVDTISRGTSGILYGFGFTSPVNPREIFSADLEAMIGGSEWVRIATLSESETPAPYTRAVTDSLPLVFDGTSLTDLPAGRLTTRLICQLSDGWFVYADTVFGDGQVYLRDLAEPLVVPESFAPTVVAPESITRFTATLNFSGAFGDSVEVIGASLTLTNDRTKMRSVADISDPFGRNLEFPEVTFPAAKENTVWDAVLNVSYVDFEIIRTSFIPLPAVTVGPVKQIVIAGVSALTPNFPRVNINQNLPLEVTLRNVAPLSVEDVFLRIESGKTGLDTLVSVGFFAPSEERILQLDVKAPTSPSMQSELRLTGASERSVRVEDSTTLSFITETPASIRLSGVLSGVTEGDVGPITTIGTVLRVKLALENAGMAQISTGRARIRAAGAGISFDSTIGVSDAEKEVTLGVALSDGAVTVSAELEEFPLDLNVAEAAALSAVGADLFSESIQVVASVSKLYASVSTPEQSGLLRGETIEIATVELSHDSPDRASILRLENLKLLFMDPAGNLVDPDLIIEADLLQASLDGEAVAFGNSVRDREMVLTFGPNALPAGATFELKFRARLRSDGSLNAFRLQVPFAGIIARSTTGIEIGRTVTATSPPGAPPREEKTFTLVSSAFSTSFQMRENPFNPDLGANDYSYSLSADYPLIFHVYTLTGKEVYRESFARGAGVNQITWDGRNGEGRLVRDGVYVLILTNEETGETATVKQAVIR